MLSFRIATRVPLFALSLLALLAISACSESDSPDQSSGNLDSSETLGNLDPGAGSFVLKTMDEPTPDGHPLLVDLVGSDMTVDADSNRVSLMVALHNRHQETLYGPAMVWVEEFEPQDVYLRNADQVRVPLSPQDSPLNPGPEPGIGYGMDYSDLLGEDGVLSPGETSAARQWTFQLGTQMEPFSFAARAHFGLEPVGSILGGVCFWDENRNGQPDFGEGVMPHGLVRVTLPGGQMEEVLVDEAGRWEWPLSQAGLYTVFYEPMIETFAPIAFSTPNPRQVVITTGPDGELQSFIHANFGVFTDIVVGPPQIQISNAPLDSLHREPWTLASARIVDDHFLKLEVGFSGCQPDHIWRLFTDGAFMESMPPQVRVLAVHDTAEDCDAAFMGQELFDLGPLLHLFMQTYGPGVLVLNVQDYHGNMVPVEWGIFPED